MRLATATIRGVSATQSITVTVLPSDETPQQRAERLAQRFVIPSVVRSGASLPAAPDGTSIAVAAVTGEVEVGDTIVSSAEEPVDVEITVRVTDAATAAATASGLLDAAEVDGVVGLAFIEGWPYAALLEPDRVGERFEALMETPLFAQGGSFTVAQSTPGASFFREQGSDGDMLDVKRELARGNSDRASGNYATQQQLEALNAKIDQLIGEMRRGNRVALVVADKRKKGVA